MVFSTHVPEDSLIYNKAYVVLKEAFRRLGMDFTMEVYPGHRALELSNSGEMDGEASRIAGLERAYPNLMIIPVAQQTVDVYAFTTKKSVALPNGWSDLKDYDVVYVRGIPFISNKLKEFDVDSHEVNSPVLQFEFLKSQRADVLISGKEAISSSLSEENKKVLRRIDPPLSTIEVYAYVNAKNAELVEPLTRTLREMKADGTYELLIGSVSGQ